jgi:predicted DNA-binding antitoxin AbrB/MazE fold protein
MSLEVEATYENGVLKLDQPLPLAEHERVVVFVSPKADREDLGQVRTSSSTDSSSPVTLPADVDEEQAIWEELDRTAMTYEEREALWKHLQSRKQ